ncbi:MAG: DNA repair protein RecO [Betaproteobacteria bacterium]|nr:DNA repair protein RecO [Betaproteobacteria bacterium]
MSKDALRQAGEGYVLHSYPYKETSLLVEVFTRIQGRITLVARSARRPRSAMRGTLMAFQPLSLAWMGKGEVKTLTKAEWLGGVSLLRGEALLCGFYLNELLLRLLAREDAHESLFDRYSDAMRSLSSGIAPAPILRRFEKALLRELGYALLLDRDAATGAQIDPERYYTYDPEKGPLPANGADGDLAISGRTLVSLARDEFDDARILNEARSLMRGLIDHRLEARPLNSRRVFKELLEL